MRATTAVLCLIAAARVAAQQPAERSPAVAREIRLGDSLQTSLHPEAAVVRFQAALALDSLDYEALWKAARAVIDVAKQIESADEVARRRRDSLYTRARALAEKAVRVNPEGAQGHSAVAQAVGRLARTKSGKEKVRFAKIIFDEATRAIALDSTNDAAYHVLGAWHAEVKRLSGVTRFFAKTLFGAGFMDQASWVDAQRDLERAVALRPTHIFHRLELARIYVDVGKYTAAREQLTAIHDLPIGDVLDTEYQTQAAQLLDDIKSVKDKT